MDCTVVLFVVLTLFCDVGAGDLGAFWSVVVDLVSLLGATRGEIDLAFAGCAGVIGLALLPEPCIGAVTIVGTVFFLEFGVVCLVTSGTTIAGFIFLDAAPGTMAAGFGV